ncbi:hypothetical protein QTO34_019982 [Cnephaeus nilssonii]|uniref:Coiled-coil domain-containing protein 196 n=1 Tax=Cnephaeus nilssonii TaxID=3371016 RepID=A0AA40LN92_CNENI|nr:hypothetical protein QTO34_019982 [Eptesicus nilssonii]
MTSSSDSPGSQLPPKTRSSKIDCNFLKELNEDLKLRKLELLELLTPLEDKNNPLIQKLMSNLEEKQRSLQIMRQIMAGKGSEESSALEIIKEAEDMKQNLERKNKMLRKEMEMLWNKTFNTEEFGDQQKASQIKNKANLQDGKASRLLANSFIETYPVHLDFNFWRVNCTEKQQRKIEWVRYQEQANNLQNDFNGKVHSLRLRELKKESYDSNSNLSLAIAQVLLSTQAFLSFEATRCTVGTTTMGRATKGKNESNVRVLGSQTYTEQGTKGSLFDDVGGRLFFLRSLTDESLKISKASTPFAWTDLKT